MAPKKDKLVPASDEEVVLTPAPTPSAELNIDDLLSAMFANQQPGLPEMFGNMPDAMTFEDNIGDDTAGLPIQYVGFPQGKGSKYIETFKYTVYVGGRNDDSLDETRYHKELELLWVDALLERPQRGKPFGGRLMWPFKPDGTRDLDKPQACSSPNGFFPLPQFIGTEVQDFRRGVTHKIGYHRDVSGSWVPDANAAGICANCPLSVWMDVGSSRVQMCKNNWSWIMYAPELDTLVKISGGNAGVQMALEGRKKDSVGAKADGSMLPGIESLFREQPNRVFRVPVDALVSTQHKYVTALFTSDAEDAKPHPAIIVGPDGALNETFIKAKESGYVKAVQVSIPTYLYAPKGRPEVVGGFEDAPVFPVIMRAVKNNFKQGDKPSPTAVPDFTLGTRQITQDEYQRYLAKRQEYQDGKWRDILMGGELATRINDRLQLAAGPINVQLPAGAPAPVLTIMPSDVPIDE